MMLIRITHSSEAAPFRAFCVTGLSVLFLCSSVEAGEWSIQPRANVEQSFTDNVRSVSDGAESDLITTASAGIGVSGVGRRLQLNFDYNNSAYIMKSRGYFTDEEWENATSQADEDDPGKVDIEVLGVDGIIPDSSFKVWEPIPLWPLYVCIIPLIVMLGIFAVLFYAQEEYNMFPWLDQGFKYWSGKLHQSWRLFKHRFRKA